MVDRDRMLMELTAAMQQHHARRRSYRRVTTTLAVIAVTAGAVLIARPLPQYQTPADPVVTVVRNTPRTGLIRTIGDNELLERLTELARPTGLIRSEGRVWLTDPPV
jgi:hypothetical protein